MIYLQTEQMYRKFLQPAQPDSVKVHTWKWWRWWDRLAKRILPRKNAARLGFLETLKYKIWMGVLEIALHRRNTEWMAHLEPVHCQTGNINNWLENSPVTHMNVAILLTLDLFTESLLLIF